MLAGGKEVASTKSITPHMTTAYHSEVERSQSVWWYLMLGVFLLAVGELFFSYGYVEKRRRAGTLRWELRLGCDMRRQDEWAFRRNNLSPKTLGKHLHIDLFSSRNLVRLHKRD